MPYGDPVRARTARAEARENGKAPDAPTPQETRLVEETSRRVETYDTHQLLYDFDEDKKGESRGTEAVLYALILASADAGQAGREPSDATRRAMTRLWQRQRANGAWEWLDFGLEPFESIDSAYQGAAFAALAVGMTPALSSGPDARAGIAEAAKLSAGKLSESEPLQPHLGPAGVRLARRAY